MSEILMSKVVMNILREVGLHPVRVENPANPGTPDINYVEGWVELKYAENWPKDKTKPLKIRHFRPEQKVWIRKRRMAHGQVFLLLKVGKMEWLLFEGETAVALLGQVNREQLIDASLKYWYGAPASLELGYWLNRNLDGEE